MSTETKIDLTEIRDRLRRARRAEEPIDAADQWAALGGEVPALVDEIARLRRSVLAVAEDLEQYAADLRPEKLPMSERKLAYNLRKIVAGETA